MASLMTILVIIGFFLTKPLTARSSRHSHSRITVVGAVYCDTCSRNAFSKHSYFLPGVDVEVRCKFKAKSKRSTETSNYSVNTTTDDYGVYKLEIRAVEGINCADGVSVVSMCEATLLHAPPPNSHAPPCSVPSLRTASNAISIKSDQDNICIYSLNALSFKPKRVNATLCPARRSRKEVAGDLEASKCFFPWPNLPSIFHFPPIPWPFNIPFTDLPPFPPTAIFSPPPPSISPPFRMWDPRTWIPSAPPASNQNP